MRIKKSERIFPAKVTSFLASIVKNLILRRAHITAKVRKRQERVLRSKYPKYSISGGTKKQVIIATNAAMQKTVFFFMNFSAFKLSPSNKILQPQYYILKKKICQYPPKKSAKKSASQLARRRVRCYLVLICTLFLFITKRYCENTAAADEKKGKPKLKVILIACKG